MNSLLIVFNFNTNISNVPVCIHTFTHLMSQSLLSIDKDTELGTEFYVPTPHLRK